jgi:nucleoside-diphosphate-sugar epimerase
VKSNRWEVDLAANAEAVGLLMAHCRGATAMLHCSSTGVYEPAGLHELAETDALGDNHRVIMETYSIAKIAAEAVVRTCARLYELPTTIARLNVPYGDNGGWPAFHLAMIEAGQPVPVHPDRPNRFNPIHEDDIIRQLPGMLDAASVPATIVNWAGDVPVSVQEWSKYFGELLGVDAEVQVQPVPGASLGSVADHTKRASITGPCRVDWRDGFRDMAAYLYPDRVQAG